jgi:hypothetical protein
MIENETHKIVGDETQDDDKGETIDEPSTNTE